MEFIEVVAGIIRNKEGHFLIARRGPGKSEAGFWEFPGGKIEKFESPTEALTRELREELKIETGSFIYYETSVHISNLKEITLHCFHGSLISGEPQTDVHDRIAWVPANELNQYMYAPADRPVVQKLIEEMAV